VLLKVNSLGFRHRIPRIISFADNRGNERIFLGQWRNKFLLRFMDQGVLLNSINSDASSSGILEMDSSGILTIIAEHGSTTMYFNNEQIGDFIGLDTEEFFASAELASMVLGNSPIGDGSWKGEIRGLALHRGSLSARERQERSSLWEQGDLDSLADFPGTILLFGFEEMSGRRLNNRVGFDDLTLPSRISPIKREFMSLPPQRYFGTRSFLRDAAVNVSGFVPFGIAFSLGYFFRRRKNGFRVLLLTVLTGGSLSFLIEASQAFLLSRNSSLTDLILNIIGTAAGVIIIFPILLWSRDPGEEQG
jgi:VanZ family protein